MANKSVLELAVGTGQWDSGLKKAKQALDNFTSAQGGLQQALAKDNGDMAEFIKMMGNMDSTAKTTKQQLREISNVLTDFTAIYRNLTDEQKSSPFGQELAKGIDKLTERAGTIKDAMEDVALSIRNAASDTRVFDQMAQGMSVATAGFQGLTGAGKLLGIEMGNDVEVIAKLQAAMAVTNSLTTIQTALQKQSALMQGVQAVQAAAAAAAQTSLAGATGAATVAQAAFNAVAKANPYVLLGTAIAAVGTALWAFASASNEAKKKEEELAKAEEEATKKAQEQRDAFVNASASAMNTASRISSLQVAYKQANTEMEKTSILKQAQSEFKKLGIECKGVHDAQTLLIRDGSKIIEMIQLQGNAAALAAIRMEKFKESFKMLMENGYSASAAASLASYNKDVIELDGQINKIQGRIQSIKGTLPISGNGPKGNKTTKQEDTNFAADSIMAQEKEVQRLTDAWNRASGAMRDGILKDLEAAKQKLEEMKKIPTAELGDVVVTGSKMKGVTKAFENGPINFDSINTYISGIRDQLKNADLGSEMYNSLTEKMKDATTMQTLLQELMDRGMEGADLEKAAASLKEKLLSPEGIDQEAVQKWLEELNKKIKDAGGVPLELNTQTGEVTDKKDKKKDDKSFSKEFSNIVGGVSSIASGIQQMGVEMPKELQSVLGVLSGISSIMTGITALLTLIQIDTKTTAVASTADAIIPFANGGIVPHAASGILMGRSFSGDNIGNVRLNAGELVLNKAQQYTLSQQLTDGGFSGVQLDTVIGAEEIRLVLNNNGRRTGRGEYVQNRNRRF